ncbi:putative transposase [Arthrobacter sp. VKM Ac-2550]|nr:putative transposase [Arthrobacter sp. VKM Ac-2550]
MDVDEPVVSADLPREAVVRLLLSLDAAGRLTTEDVRLAAEGSDVSERTVWRWLAQARSEGEVQSPRERFEITDEVRERLAFWRGNVSAVHRELVAAAGEGGKRPSRATVQRAVARDVLRGELAGLRGGERARRAHEVFLRRPRVHRNEVWEADHVEVPVEVLLPDDRLVKPWVTWFVDVGTDAVCGAAVTPGPPSRESILAALRAAISLEEPYGPPGGLPGAVRIDRGKDFLSKTVHSVLAGLAVRVVALPGYTPHLKGTVESLNNAAETMFFAALPRYTHAQQGANGKPTDPDAPALPFEAFVAEFLTWVRWWNGENEGHTIAALGGRTPLQAWAEDPTPLSTVPAADLRLLMLEDDGRARTITPKGVSWRGRHYVAAWMTGQVGLAVRVRHMPHHEHEIEVFGATSGKHLGSATLADAASAEEVAALHRARSEQQRRLRADLRAAEKARRVRYAAATEAAPLQPVQAVTAEAARAELATAQDTQLQAAARVDLFAPGPPSPEWVLPHASRTGPKP